MTIITRSFLILTLTTLFISFSGFTLHAVSLAPLETDSWSTQVTLTTPLTLTTETVIITDAAHPPPPFFSGPAPRRTNLRPAALPGQVTLSLPLAFTATPLITPSWEVLSQGDFEENALPPGCYVYGEGTPSTLWGIDDAQAANGQFALWPAADGPGAVDPATSTYPNEVYSVFECGPFDRKTAELVIAEFSYKISLTDGDEGDVFRFGYSLDYNTYQWREWTGVQDWGRYILWISDVQGEGSIWFSWVFETDGDSDTGTVPGNGVWLDDIHLERNNIPSNECGAVDPGDKGVVLSAYETVGELGEYPVIRPGRGEILQGLIEAEVRWVRLVFEVREGATYIERRDFDQMVDTLCAYNISVLGC